MTKKTDTTVLDSILKARSDSSQPAPVKRRLQLINKDVLKDVAKGALILALTVASLGGSAIAAEPAPTDTLSAKVLKQGLPSCLNQPDHNRSRLGCGRGVLIAEPVGDILVGG